ncbi:TetR/AcrR family transcriptional regulator [Breoghania sp. JC706]|uniref:TetR/AcrR family transcriptional regulator n=1 Tax=Breoghania sp. JC706 TaxID=3117732 RepID=UPI0030088818
MRRAAGAARKPTRDAIVDSAERAILLNGYKSLNFRDIASEVGIKSSSVHYHFPTKGDLSAEVMRRYRNDFASRLEDPKHEPKAAQAALNAFIDGFKDQVVGFDNMSLCVVLSAEKNLLDEATRVELRAFYDLKLDWLSKVVSAIAAGTFSQGECDRYACKILASLHGASVLVKATGDTGLFELSVEHWRDLLTRIR